MFGDFDDVIPSGWGDASITDDTIEALLARTRAVGTDEEFETQTGVVAMMASVIAASATNVVALATHAERKRVRATKTVTRIAAVAAGVLIGTSAAAATGNLPGGAQSTVARAAAHIGIQLPDPKPPVPPGSPPATSPLTAETTEQPAHAEQTLAPRTEPAPPTPPATLTPTTASASTVAAVPVTLQVLGTEPGPGTPATAPDGPQGPDATGPAKQGLCNAWRNHQSKGAAVDSVAMRNLEAAAAAAGQTVATFCDDSTAPASTTTVENHGHSKPTKPDKPPKRPKKAIATAIASAANSHGIGKAIGKGK